MTKLYLESGEKITVEFSLMESKAITEERIKYYTDKLNSANNTEEIKVFTESLKNQKYKLKSINNLLNKLL
jgi:hypothetical protein|tara:strand:+ start:2052 stop:2264 length:213 start_codon:yes stop_codon:yes gene_type:complete